MDLNAEFVPIGHNTGIPFRNAFLWCFKFALYINPYEEIVHLDSY